jgi:hypothetical protein
MTLSSKTISRRGFVSGTTAIGASAVLGALFGPSLATAAAKAVPTVAPAGVAANGTYPFFVYHCSLVHKAMSDKLTRIVADPAISVEETNKALRSTRCPCCDTQINASYPAIYRENGKVYV